MCTRKRRRFLRSLRSVGMTKVGKAPLSFRAKSRNLPGPSGTTRRTPPRWRRSAPNCPGRWRASASTPTPFPWRTSSGWASLKNRRNPLRITDLRAADSAAPQTLPKAMWWQTACTPAWSRISTSPAWTSTKQTAWRCWTSRGLDRILPGKSCSTARSWAAIPAWSS